jgi:hypothetical protein
LERQALNGKPLIDQRPPILAFPMICALFVDAHECLSQTDS